MFDLWSVIWLRSSSSSAPLSSSSRTPCAPRTQTSTDSKRHVPLPPPLDLAPHLRRVACPRVTCRPRVSARASRRCRTSLSSSSCRAQRRRRTSRRCRCDLGPISARSRAAHEHAPRPHARIRSQVRNARYSAFIEGFTSTTYAMVIVSDPTIQPATTLINIEASRAHFEALISNLGFS